VVLMSNLAYDSLNPNPPTLVGWAVQFQESIDVGKSIPALPVHCRKGSPGATGEDRRFG
jgi:hypothetical protein